MNSFMIGICVASLIISFIAIAAAFVSCAFVIGWKNSTHQVQVYNPAAENDADLMKEFEKVEKELSKGLEHI